MYKISAHSEAPLGPIGRSANTIATGVLKTAQKTSEQAGHDACLLIALSQFFAVCHFRADHIRISDAHISGRWTCFQMELQARHADNFPPPSFLYLSPSLLLFLLFPSRAVGSRRGG